MGTIIRNRFGRTSPEARELREAQELADAEAREFWDDQDWKAQMHADMVETIWLGLQAENLVELMARTENAEEFEEITIEEATGLEVFWVSQGGQIDQSQINEHVWRLPRHFVGYQVSEFEDKIRSGFSRWMSKLVPMAVTQMDASIQSRLLRTYQAAIPGVSSPSYIQTNGFDLDAVNDALTVVEDAASGWPTATGAPPTIIGRGTMVDQFLNALQANDNFAPETQQEIINTGMLGTYRGARIVKLKNFFDRNRVSYFPANELIITSPAAAIVGFWGGDKSWEWVPDGSEYQYYKGRRTVGMAVDHPEFARRYKDTSKAA